MTPEREEHVRRLHREAILIDAHNDSLRAVAIGDSRYNPLPDGPARPRRLWESGESGHWDFPRALTAGQTGQVTNILVPRPGGAGQAGQVTKPQQGEAGYTRTCLKSHYRALADLDHSPQLALLVETASDLERAHRDGVVGLVLAIEGAEALEGDLEVLHAYYHLGVRMVGLTWMYRNEVAEGNWEDSGAGLSDFGREVVREMNGLGIVVDIAHATEQTFWDALESSSAPVVCSHGSCRSLVVDFADHAPSRYLDDEQMRALASQGGVMGIFFSAERELAKPGADVHDLAKFFVHAAEVMGPEHLGFGSDFDGGFPPAGLEDVRGLPNLTSALIDAGFSDDELLGILGGNWLRVFRTVWDAE